MKLVYVAGLAILSLVGCATQQQSQAEIDSYAKGHYRSYICAAAGFMDQETAAKGMAFANSQVNRSQSAQYQESVRRHAATGERADQQNCANLRLQILTAMAAKENKSAAPAQTYQPTTTNCSTYFGQTHCTTF